MYAYVNTILKKFLRFTFRELYDTMGLKERKGEKR